MLTLKEFEAQVKRGYYSPAHQMLYFDHPLGRIMQLIYDSRVESMDLLVELMYQEYRFLEASRVREEGVGSGT